MNKMNDPRFCINFHDEKVCPQASLEIMNYLDNRVITPMSQTFAPEEFDRAFEFCVNCEQFLPYPEFSDVTLATH